MAGFRVPVRGATITFDGTDYDGAVVDCVLDIPLEVYFEIVALSEKGETETVSRIWAEHALKSWNLEDSEGNPLPATVEGLFKLPPAIFTVMLQKWTEAVAQAPAPLRKGSLNGVAGAA